jgi:hypothetical protein
MARSAGLVIQDDNKALSCFEMGLRTFRPSKSITNGCGD